ncbi:MAG: response regulator [Candidatus Gastranaerophilales bacterium]|nr:response regulator [Candidatus Gastranaerophilales bacterium]
MATVLLVDDSKVSRKILAETLEKGGFEIVGEASNGEEGYLKYKELRPDIVTMDITMPTMDGIESLSLIKNENENAKVVMVTAAGQKEKMVEALKRGAEEFIVKPFNDKEVLETLNRVAEKVF